MNKYNDGTQSKITNVIFKEETIVNHSNILHCSLIHAFSFMWELFYQWPCNNIIQLNKLSDKGGGKVR